jgi:RND family efflux transporter MFP subunit
MKALALQGKLETARRQEAQVARNSEALLAQAKAVLDAANEELKKEEETLAHCREQPDKCKINAPEEGLVAYALSDNRYYRDEIRVGAPARPRQHLLSLPNLKQMQVKTAVHESVLDQIKPGLSATIRVDAFPDRVYHGTIQSVAVMPDPGGYLSSDTKVYETIVIINDEVSQIKPGMTAVVEIHVEELRDVLSVPVQAVVQADGQTWCYIDQLGTPQRRDVKLGRTNDKFVQILEGLEADDRVVLNPMAIIEDSSDRSPRKSDAPRPEKGTGAGSPEKTQAPAARPAA